MQQKWAGRWRFNNPVYHVIGFVVRGLLLEMYSATTLPVLPYTYRAAEWHAEERARLESIGHTPSFVDNQIAAIAATEGLILVTRNTDDFTHFKDLHVENWFES